MIQSNILFQTGKIIKMIIMFFVEFLFRKMKSNLWLCEWRKKIISQLLMTLLCGQHFFVEWTENDDNRGIFDINTEKKKEFLSQTI